MAKPGPKPSAHANDITSMIEAMERQEKEFDARIINKLPDLYDLLLNMATSTEGRYAKVSMKDRKAVGQYLIERVEAKYGDNKVVKQESPDNENKDGGDNVYSMSGIVSTHMDKKVS